MTIRQIKKLDDTKSQPPKVCRGRFYRCRASTYKNKKGEIVYRTIMYPLKRMSCKGCMQCDYLDDHANEVDHDIGGDELRAGHTYELVCHGWQDYEGEWDSELLWREVCETEQIEAKLNERYPDYNIALTLSRSVQIEQGRLLFTVHFDHAGERKKFNTGAIDPRKIKVELVLADTFRKHLIELESKQG